MIISCVQKFIKNDDNSYNKISLNEDRKMMIKKW